MSKHIHTKNRTRGSDFRGFTLTELLIVITIISMLASMSMIIVSTVQQSAQVSATEVNITRLDLIVTELYESYLHRRIDVPTNQIPQNFRTPQLIARIRLHFIHDTMRMEMPSNWHEALNVPQAFPGTGMKVQDSPLRESYEDAFIKAVCRVKGDNSFVFPRKADGSIDLTALLDDDDVTIVRTHAPAKLLYLIVMNAVPEAREVIHERDIATSEEDGLSYFIDAWGQPIYFLRWAPGFSGGDRQPDLWKWTGTKADQSDNATYWKSNLSPDALTDKHFEDYYTTFADILDKNERLDRVFPTPGDKGRYIFQTAIEKPDPLDVMKVRASAVSGANRSRPGWLLVPLVYSAGPDGEYGITILDDKETDEKLQIMIDPFADGYGAPFGTKGEHLDNIHNHVVGGR